MKMRSVLEGLVFGVVAIVMAGCSSSSDGGTSGGKCSAPVISGSPFASTGTGSVHGSGTLPAGIPDGQELELLTDMGNESLGVLPENLADEPLTCGSSFTFTITHLDAGTYALDYDIYDPKSQSATPSSSGTSTNTFVVADGQSVEFNPTF